MQTALDPKRFLNECHQVIELISDHFSSLGEISPRPEVKPGELSSLFSKEAPLHGVQFSEILGQVKESIIPGVTQWQSPRFMSFYPANTSLPAMYADILITAIGSVGLQWSSNPIGTELECVVMDWLAQLLHCPKDSPYLHTSRVGGGLMQNTAGEGLCTMITAARVRTHLLQRGVERMEELPKAERDEIFYSDSSRLVAYMSDQTHFSGMKAARVAGLRVHQIPSQKLSNGNWGITQGMLREAIEEDRKRGLVPCWVQLNYGSTNTSGSDDIDSWELDSSWDDIWIHVDAAYGGAALILHEYAEQSRKIQEVADSFNINGSKWLLCGFDSAFFFVKDRQRLIDCYSATGDYLDSSVPDTPYTPQFKDWNIPLGRKFRALRIWLVLSYFGQTGLRSFLEQSIQQSDQLRSWIDESDGFEQTVSTHLGLVCFHPIKRDRTLELVEYLNSSVDGKKSYLVYPSNLCGEPFIRIALGGVSTSHDDVIELWEQCLQWQGQKN